MKTSSEDKRCSGRETCTGYCVLPADLASGFRVGANSSPRTETGDKKLFYICMEMHMPFLVSKVVMSLRPLPSRRPCNMKDIFSSFHPKEIKSLFNVLQIIAWKEIQRVSSENAKWLVDFV